LGRRTPHGQRYIIDFNLVNDANCACFIANCNLRIEGVRLILTESHYRYPGLAVAQLPLLLKGKARASTWERIHSKTKVIWIQ